MKKKIQKKLGSNVCKSDNIQVKINVRVEDNRLYLFYFLLISYF